MSCGPGEKEGMSGSTLCFTAGADRALWIPCMYTLEQFWEYGKLWLWAKPNPQWDQQILTATFPRYAGHYCLEIKTQILCWDM